MGQNEQQSSSPQQDTSRESVEQQLKTASTQDVTDTLIQEVLNQTLARAKDEAQQQKIIAFIQDTILGKGPGLSLKSFDVSQAEQEQERGFIDQAEFMRYKNYLYKAADQIITGQFDSLTTQFANQPEQMSLAIDIAVHSPKLKPLFEKGIPLETIRARAELIDRLTKIRDKGVTDKWNAVSEEDLAKAKGNMSAVIYFLENDNQDVLQKSTVTTNVESLEGDVVNMVWGGMHDETISCAEFAQRITHDSSLVAKAFLQKSSSETTSRESHENTQQIERLQTLLRAVELGKKDVAMKPQLLAIHTLLEQGSIREAINSTDTILKQFDIQFTETNVGAIAGNDADLAKALRQLGDAQTAAKYMVASGKEALNEGGLKQQLEQKIKDSISDAQVKAGRKYIEIMQSLSGTLEGAELQRQDRTKVVTQLTAIIALDTAFSDVIVKHIREHGSADLPPILQEYDDMKGLHGFLNMTDENAKMTREIAIGVVSMVAMAFVPGALAGLGGLAFRLAEAANAAGKVRTGLAIARGATVLGRAAEGLEAVANTKRATAVGKTLQASARISVQTAEFTALQSGLEHLSDTYISDPGARSAIQESFWEKFGNNAVMFAAFEGMGALSGGLLKSIGWTETAKAFSTQALSSLGVQASGDMAVMFALHAMESGQIAIPEGQELWHSIGMALAYRLGFKGLEKTFPKLTAATRKYYEEGATKYKEPAIDKNTAPTSTELAPRQESVSHSPERPSTTSLKDVNPADITSEMMSTWEAVFKNGLQKEKIQLARELFGIEGEFTAENLKSRHRALVKKFPQEVGNRNPETAQNMSILIAESNQTLKLVLKPKNVQPVSTAKEKPAEAQVADRPVVTESHPAEARADVSTRPSDIPNWETGKEMRSTLQEAHGEGNVLAREKKYQKIIELAKKNKGTYQERIARRVEVQNRYEDAVIILDIRPDRSLKIDNTTIKFDAKNDVYIIERKMGDKIFLENLESADITRIKMTEMERMSQEATTQLETLQRSPEYETAVKRAKQDSLELTVRKTKKEIETLEGKLQELNSGKSGDWAVHQLQGESWEAAQVRTRTREIAVTKERLERLKKTLSTTEDNLAKLRSGVSDSKSHGSRAEIQPPAVERGQVALMPYEQALNVSPRELIEKTTRASDALMKRQEVAGFISREISAGESRLPAERARNLAGSLRILAERVGKAGAVAAGVMVLMGVYSDSHDQEEAVSALQTEISKHDFSIVDQDTVQASSGAPVQVPAPPDATTYEEKSIAVSHSYADNWANAKAGKQAASATMKVSEKVTSYLNVRGENGKSAGRLKQGTQVTILAGETKLVDGLEKGEEKSLPRTFVKIKYTIGAKEQTGWVAEDYLTKIEGNEILEKSGEPPQPQVEKNAKDEKTPAAPEKPVQKAESKESPKEITRAQLTEMIRMMSDSILLTVDRKSQNGVYLAKLTLGDKINGLIMQTLGVSGTIDGAQGQQWANKKIDQINFRKNKETEVPIEISPNEKKELLQSFITANQQTIHLVDTDREPLPSPPKRDPREDSRRVAA